MSRGAVVAKWVIVVWLIGVPARSEHGTGDSGVTPRPSIRMRRSAVSRSAPVTKIKSDEFCRDPFTNLCRPDLNGYLRSGEMEIKDLSKDALTDPAVAAFVQEQQKLDPADNCYKLDAAAYEACTKRVNRFVNKMSTPSETRKKRPNFS